jgi:hypothetical protein
MEHDKMNLQHVILETKIRKLETERHMRLSQSFLLKEYIDNHAPEDKIKNAIEALEGENFPPEQAEIIASQAIGGDQEAISTLEKSGSLGSSVAKGLAKGAAEAGIKKVAEKGVMAALKKYGIKSIPFVGSVASLISALAEGTMFIKDLYVFAQKMQELSGVELQGVTSLLGEYTLVDASAEDLNRIADALEVSQMSEADAKELYALYWNAMNRFKHFLVDLLLTVKEFSAGITFGAAIAISVLPVETAFKELLFYVYNVIEDLKQKMPDLINVLLDSFIAVQTHSMPIMGFLFDHKRIVAFSRIDDAMTSLANRTSRDTALDVVSSTAAGGKRMWDIADAAGDAIAKSVGDIKFEGKGYYNFDKFAKIY